MQLHQTQKQVAKDITRFRVVNCGRGWGKTTLAIEEMIGIAVSKKDRKVLYIANTYQQARDIAWKSLKKRLDPITVSTNESRLEITIHTQDGGQSEIILRGWEAVDTLRGQEFDFIVVDEVASMRNFWVGWQDVLRPTLRMSQGGVLFISTPKGFNHFYDLFNTSDEDYKSFHFTSYDNPHLPREEIDGAKRTLPEDSFAQEWMADFRKQQGLVYKEFNRGVHTFDDLTDYSVAETIVGVDWGYRNPAAVLTIQRDNDSNYYVRYEYYKTEQTDAQIAEYVASIQAQAIYPDPENPAGIKELRDRGVNVREVNKNFEYSGKKGVQAGITKVRELFKQNRIFIHKDCLNVLQELETYRYPEAKEGKNDDESPVKEHDHALDALRYVLTMHSASNPILETTDFNLYSHDYA